MGNNKEYFKSLTGLRAVAALLVFFHHCHIKHISPLIDRIQNEFHIGVAIFFVLSGFLIANKYYFATFKELKAYLYYLQNRFARIYPLYMVAYVCCLLVTLFWLKREVRFDEFLLNISLLKGFSHVYNFTGISQSWTLTVEFTFYLIAPLFFVFSRKTSFGFTFTITFIIMALIVVCSYYFKISDLKFLILYTFWGRFTEFFLGVFLFLLINTGNIVLRFKSFTIVGVFGVIVTVLLLTYLQSESNDCGLNTGFGMAMNNIVLPVFVCFVILGLIKEETLLQRLFSLNFFQVLGKSSYAFYLLHMGGISVLIYQFFPKIYLSLPIIWILSIGAFYFIEVPLHKKLKSSSNA